MKNETRATYRMKNELLTFSFNGNKSALPKVMADITTHTQRKELIRKVRRNQILRRMGPV